MSELGDYEPLFADARAAEGPAFEQSLREVFEQHQNFSGITNVPRIPEDAFIIGMVNAYIENAQPDFRINSQFILAETGGKPHNEDFVDAYCVVEHIQSLKQSLYTKGGQRAVIFLNQVLENMIEVVNDKQLRTVGAFVVYKETGGSGEVYTEFLVPRAALYAAALAIREDMAGDLERYRNEAAESLPKKFLRGEKEAQYIGAILVSSLFPSKEHLSKDMAALPSDN